MIEKQFKDQIRNEIIYFRTHTVMELKKSFCQKNINKNQEELNTLLLKKEKYDSIPEEEIEEYINQLYVFYVSQQEIIKKIEQYNFKNDNLDNEDIDEAIINVEEMNDLDFAKTKLYKKILNKLSDLCIALFNPTGTVYNDLAYPAFFGMFGGLGVAFMYLSTLLGAKILNQPYPEQNHEALKTLTLIMAGVYGMMSIPYILETLTDIVTDLKNYRFQKKQNPESIDLLKKIGIYDLALTQAEANQKLEEIMNKGLVK